MKIFPLLRATTTNSNQGEIGSTTISVAEEDIISAEEDNIISENSDPLFRWEKDGHCFTELDDEDVLRYFTWAAQGNGIKELEELLQPENRRENRTACLESALNMAAYCGHLDSVILLINAGADSEKLVGTTAYTNHSSIETYLNEQRGITL